MADLAAGQCDVQVGAGRYAPGGGRGRLEGPITDHGLKIEVSEGFFSLKKWFTVYLVF